MPKQLDTSNAQPLPPVDCGSKLSANEEISQHPYILKVERMLAMVPKMTGEEKAMLEAWEKVNLGMNDKGTTDWPGWAAITLRLSH